MVVFSVDTLSELMFPVVRKTGVLRSAGPLEATANSFHSPAILNVGWVNGYTVLKLRRNVNVVLMISALQATKFLKSLETELASDFMN